MATRNYDGSISMPADEFAAYQRKAAVNDFVEPIFNNKDLNHEARQLIKKHYPDVDQGAWDSEQRLKAEIAALKKEREDEKKAVQDKAEVEMWAKRKADAQKKYGLSEEEMGKVEQIMKDEKIYSYEEAALLKSQREPKPIEATMNSHYWNHDKQDGFKDIAADPEKWGFNTLFKDVSRLQQKQKMQEF